MAFQLTIGTLGTIITEVNFPSSLRQGEKITGTLKIKNPFAEYARVLVETWTLWDNHYFAVVRELSASGEVTLNFPSDFTMREPTDAPDPVMPNADAAIYILATVLSQSGAQQTEHLTVVIRLQTAPGIVTAKIAGIPVWALLILLPLSGLFSYVLYKKYRKRL
jgi:hypothetical protein